MIITDYGILLKQIGTEDLELIREWRNSEYVKQYMVFKDHITSEMQLNWFNRINNEHHYYFLIIHENTPIGLANIKDIDLEKQSGESGIFMNKPEYTDSDLGVKATLALLDFAFLTLNLVRLYQTITTLNTAALNFNKHLGVVITETTGEINKGFLLKETYLTKTNKIRNFLNQQ